MPSKKKKYNARFPPARIKKIMQTDEDVGKVAAAVPVIISRALELFIESLILKCSETTRARNARTLSTCHIKHTIESEKKFDFLRDLVANIPDVQQNEDDQGEVSNTTESTVREPSMSGSKRKASASTSSSTSADGQPVKRPRGRPRKVKPEDAAAEEKKPEPRKRKSKDEAAKHSSTETESENETESADESSSDDRNTTETRSYDAQTNINLPGANISINYTEKSDIEGATHNTTNTGQERANIASGDIDRKKTEGYPDISFQCGSANSTGQVVSRSNMSQSSTSYIPTGELPSSNTTSMSPVPNVQPGQAIPYPPAPISFYGSNPQPTRTNFYQDTSACDQESSGS